MPYVQSTTYEEEILRSRMEEFLPAMVHLGPAAIQRYFIFTEGDSVLVKVETNDDNDDGYPDGAWTYWSMRYPSVDQALKGCGKCRVGISGVIVTVTLDGKEIR